LLFFKHLVLEYLYTKDKLVITVINKYAYFDCY